MKEGYVKEENENLIVWYSGVCYWIHQNDPCKDMVMISEKIMNEQIDYNELFGFYKIAIQRKSDKTWILLGDNAGSQFWVIDYQKRVFSDRLLELKEQREGDIDPDYGAILQLFSGGYILTEDTVIKNIKRTLSEYCYYISKDSIRRKCKGLKSFSASDGMQLNTLMEVLCKDLDEKHVSCVCTGGTDSRTVLAHLIHYGIKPKLILTGYPDNPDIAVAKKITDTLNLTLEIQDPSLKEEGWIQTAFDFSDGMTDIVGAFRHFNKKQWAMNEQMTYEFGGVGGEYYKNHFFHFFQWRGLHPTYERAFELLCKGITIVPSWGGDFIKKNPT